MKHIQFYTILIFLVTLTTATSCTSNCDCDDVVDEIDFQTQTIQTSVRDSLNIFTVGDTLRMDIHLPISINDINGIPRLIENTIMDDYTPISTMVERSDLGQTNYQPYNINAAMSNSYSGDYIFSSNQDGALGILVEPSDPSSAAYRFDGDIIFTETGVYRFKVTDGITFFTNEDIVHCAPRYKVPFVFSNQNSEGYFVVQVN
jgi:hypothetical protein